MAGKVSIIMPAYNCAKFIDEAVQSVINQTYKDWELIVVDDCSSDDTYEILSKYACEDSRIHLLKNEQNSGAAVARNHAIEVAGGRYLAFLDSDDVWKSTKLEKQIEYMEKNGYLFTCTSYDKINADSEQLGIIVKSLSIDYEGLLRRCPGNSTVIYNAEAIGKVTIPPIRKRNDYVMWLKVIKQTDFLHGMDEVLSSHRIGIQSISSKKASLVKYHWIVYREIEKLGVVKSAYLCLFWIFKTLLRL